MRYYAWCQSDLVRCITVLHYMMEQLHRMTARTNFQMQVAIQILLPIQT